MNFDQSRGAPCSRSVNRLPFAHVLRREVPVGSKNRKKCKNIFLFIWNICKESSGLFFPAKNPSNFLEFSQGSRKE